MHKRPILFASILLIISGTTSCLAAPKDITPSATLINISTSTTEPLSIKPPELLVTQAPPRTPSATPEPSETPVPTPTPFPDLPGNVPSGYKLETVNLLGKAVTTVENENRQPLYYLESDNWIPTFYQDGPQNLPAIGSTYPDKLSVDEANAALAVGHAAPDGFNDNEYVNQFKANAAKALEKMGFIIVDPTYEDFRSVQTATWEKDNGDGTTSFYWTVEAVDAGGNFAGWVGRKSADGSITYGAGPFGDKSLNTSQDNLVLTKPDPINPEDKYVMGQLTSGIQTFFELDQNGNPIRWWDAKDGKMKNLEGVDIIQFDPEAPPMAWMTALNTAAQDCNTLPWKYPYGPNHIYNEGVTSDFVDKEYDVLQKSTNTPRSEVSSLLGVRVPFKACWALAIKNKTSRKSYMTYQKSDGTFVIFPLINFYSIGTYGW